MCSIPIRKLTLGVCLLGSIACAAQTHPIADGAPGPTASRFGDLTDAVFASDDEAELFPASSFVRYPDAERSLGVGPRSPLRSSSIDRGSPSSRP
jgi:hypothetical protein